MCIAVGSRFVEITRASNTYLGHKELNERQRKWMT